MKAEMIVIVLNSFRRYQYTATVNMNINIVIMNIMI